MSNICFEIGIIDKSLNLTIRHAHPNIDEFSFLKMILWACVEN